MKTLNNILIDNIIQLKNTFNTRTIGGFTTVDNKTVKKGILFRSDNLARLCEYDLTIIKLLKIKRIVDFRSDNEKNKEPNNLPQNIDYLEYPINADKEVKNEIYDILNGTLKKDIKTFLIQANKDFVLKYTHVFSKFIKDFIKNPEPTLFHCTAGKDRTGFACVLILSIIGVPFETIIDEYLFSNSCINRTIDQQLDRVCHNMNISRNDGGKILPLLTVNLSYIESAFNTIKMNYENMDNYIKKGLEISNNEINILKNILLI